MTTNENIICFPLRRDKQFWDYDHQGLILEAEARALEEAVANSNPTYFR